MWEDEHARLGEKIGIDVGGFDNGQNLAVDQIKHGLPDLGGDGFEPVRLRTVVQFIWRWTKPYFEQLLRACGILSASARVKKWGILTFKWRTRIEV